MQIPGVAVHVQDSEVGRRARLMASLGLDVPEWLAYGPVAIIIVLTFIITPIHTCWYPQH